MEFTKLIFMELLVDMANSYESESTLKGAESKGSAFLNGYHTAVDQLRSVVSEEYTEDGSEDLKNILHFLDMQLQSFDMLKEAGSQFTK